MIRLHLEAGKQKWLPTWMLTAWLRLHCDEDSVDFGERLRIIELEHPTFLAHIVLIKDAKAPCLLRVHTVPSPHLERARILQPPSLIQVISVKNERLPFGIEQATI